MSTVTLNAPPGKVGLNLLRYGVVASVMSHCVLKSSIEPNDCILKVNGVDLTKKGASEIMNVWYAMENKSKTLTVRKAKRITEDIVDLTTGTTPQSSKRKALGEISNQANDDKHSINNNHKVSKVHAVDSPKSKPTSINTTAGEASKEDIDPKEVFKAVWLGKFPKLGSVWPARKLTQEEANNQIQALNPMILTTATNLKQQQKVVRSLKKQLKTAEAQVVSLKSEQKRLTQDRDDAKRDMQSDADKIVEVVTSASFQPSVEMVTHIVEDMCNLFRATTNPEPVNKSFEKLTRALTTYPSPEKRNKAIEGATRVLMRSVQSDPPIGVEHMALKRLYRASLSDAEKPQTNAPFQLIAEAIILVGSPQDEDAKRLVHSLIAATKALQDAPVCTYSNQYPYSHSNKTELPKCPILDVMLPTLETLRSSTLVDSSASESLRAAMKAALVRSLAEIQDEQDVDYSMADDADIADRQGSKVLADFLRSPTLWSQSFDLTKNGRFVIHRIIDDHIPGSFSKLRHSSEGFGQNRALTVTKVSYVDPMLTKQKHERRCRHEQLLAAMNAEESI